MPELKLNVGRSAQTSLRSPPVGRGEGPVLHLGSRLLWMRRGDDESETTAEAINGKAAVVLAWVMLEGGADRRRLAALL